MVSKKLKKIGFWAGLIIVLLIMLVGILFVTGVITFEITPVFFGWFLIIISVYSVIEFIIVKWLKII